MLPFAGIGVIPPKNKEDTTNPYILESFSTPLCRKDAPSCIVRGQYNVPKSMVTPKFFSTLTVTPKAHNDFQAPQPFSIYTTSQTYIRIPRTLGFQVFGMPTCRMNQGHATSYRFQLQLRDYQHPAVERVLKEFRKHPGKDCMLEAGTGTGKTVMGIKIMSRWGRKCAVIVHKEFLLNQWKERIAACCPDARVGIVQRDRCEHEDKDIVICMLHSIVQKKDYPEAFFDSIGLVVIDECHHIAAKTFSKVLRPFGAAHRLGLTATAERSDGLTHVLHWLMGPTVFRIQRRPGATTTTSVPIVQQLTHKPTWKEIRTTKGNILFTKMITKMVEDVARNRKIRDMLVELSTKQRKILVVSDRRQHLLTLQSMLPSTIRSAMYVGETTKKGKRKREEEKDKVSILFTTYQMGEEGLDLPFLDTLVMTTPRKKLDQIIGRILRKKEGKQTPLIVDVVDTLSIFYGMSRARMRYYRDKQYAFKK
tara:strand:- start:133 stop:1566 length:1434 start_codon:yes stop_codon:yes gene_type:complete